MTYSKFLNLFNHSSFNFQEDFKARAHLHPCLTAGTVAVRKAHVPALTQCGARVGCCGTASVYARGGCSVPHRVVLRCGLLTPLSARALEWRKSSRDVGQSKLLHRSCTDSRRKRTSKSDHRGGVRNSLWKWMLLSEGIATSATDLCGTVHFYDVALPCNQVKLCAFKYFRSVRR